MSVYDRSYICYVKSKMLKNVGDNDFILGKTDNRKAGENDKLINLKIKREIK